MIGLTVAIAVVIFFRHIINGQLKDGLLWWFNDTLNNGNPFLMLLLALPLALIVMVAGLVIIIGGLAGGIAAIGGLLYYLPGFFMGLPIVFNSFLVNHAAEPIVSTALKEGQELETRNLREALTPRPTDLKLNKPVYHYEHQAEKARALATKLNEDAHVAEAAMRRERALAALKEAEHELQEVERRTKRGRYER
jgi:hypothetical protein